MSGLQSPSFKSWWWEWRRVVRPTLQAEAWRGKVWPAQDPLAAEGLGSCRGPAPEYLECAKGACVQSGWVPKAGSPVLGSARTSELGHVAARPGLAPEPPSPQCGQGASVRILRHCPSSGLPPRTLASRVRSRLGPPPRGADRPGVLSPPAPAAPHGWGTLGTSLKLLLQSSWGWPPLLCCLVHYGELIWGRRGAARPTGSAHLSSQHRGGPG